MEYQSVLQRQGYFNSYTAKPVHRPTDALQQQTARKMQEGSDGQAETVDGEKRISECEIGDLFPAHARESERGVGEAPIRNQAQILEDLKARADRHHYEKLRE